MKFTESVWQKDLITYLERLAAYNQFSHLKWFCWNSTPEFGAMNAWQMERAKAMGLKVGLPDLQFWWVTISGERNFGFLELKRPEKRGLDGKIMQRKGALSPNQIKFQNECTFGDINHGVADNMTDAIEILKSWRLIKATL